MERRRPYSLRDLFFSHVAQTSSSPLAIEIERSEGIYLFSPDGKRYIDLVSGVSVSNLGHANKTIVEAIKKQVDRYLHLMVYGEVVQSPQVLLAKLLTENLPESLNCVYFVNSGSEANEATLKLAKRVTGRREIISFNNCYHGSTHGVMSLMSEEWLKNSFRPLLPDIRHIQFNDFSQIEQITESTAAVIIEPVQGEAGVRLPEIGYLEAIRHRCTEKGAMLIFDEIQTGFGRCGDLFAFKKYGVIPDILSLAKALGGGMPLGALIASNGLMSAWKSNPPLGHITTFGGHPVSCAAALASLELLLKEKWIGEVDRKAKRFSDALKSHPLVENIRSAGLLIAVDLHSREHADKIIKLMLEEGVMSDWFLFSPNSFRIAPPLIINDTEIDDAIKRIVAALEKLE